MLNNEGGGFRQGSRKGCIYSDVQAALQDERVYSLGSYLSMLTHEGSCGAYEDLYRSQWGSTPTGADANDRSRLYGSAGSGRD